MPHEPRRISSKTPIATLPADRIATLLEPYLRDTAPPPELYDRLSIYLDLLLKWNARTNLTALRSPEEMVRRHFGESLFTGVQLAARLKAGPGGNSQIGGDEAMALTTVLDFGSGAGFPGLPMQLLHPEWRVTLAESQGKKASFLHEAVRTLKLKAEVWPERVEALAPVAGLVRQFDAVALRAVDKMESATEEARRRVRPGGWLVSFTTQVKEVGEGVRLPGDAPGWLTLEQVGR